MKVLKSTILKKRKCEFGNFELAPENGWKISQSFIDFESGLLVVSTNDENESMPEFFGIGGCLFCVISGNFKTEQERDWILGSGIVASC